MIPAPARFPTSHEAINVISPDVVANSGKGPASVGAAAS
jgi:hypothetical protein